MRPAPEGSSAAAFAIPCTVNEHPRPCICSALHSNPDCPRCGVLFKASKARGEIMKPDIYFSTDIETDGPIPGPNSMLSLGTAVFDKTGKLQGTFTRNFHQLPDAKGDPETLVWWATQPEAWAACRKDMVTPAEGMRDFVRFVEGFKSAGRPVFIAYPAGFDFTFIYWYLMKFVGRSPFSFSAIDIKTLAMAALGCGYSQATKRNWPAAWLSKRPHTHVAIDDAIAQGEEFFNIMDHIDLHRK